METMQAILSRKSVRSYTGKKISKDALNTILKAAKAAPVGLGRYEAMHLTVIKNPRLLEALEENMRAVFKNPKVSAFYGAPELVLVSGKAAGDAPGNTDYSNAAVMVENMALAAVGLGVGCCHIWGAVMALDANPELVKKLELPEGFTPLCAIALGESQEVYRERHIPEDRISVQTIE